MAPYGTSSLVRLAAALAMAVVMQAPVAQAASRFPVLWDSGERLPAVSLAETSRLRFLVMTDFPPFSFLDSNGRLTGFHVDLAQAICRELDLLDKCQIQGLPWEELPGALRSDQGDAVLSGLPDDAGMQGIALTRAYFPLPARFATRRQASLEEPLSQALAEKRVGVMGGSRHEQMLRAWFPEAQAVVYSRESWMLQDLKDGKTDAVFADGMRLSFWLGGTNADACCMFSGGAYYAPELLGAGHRIAVDARQEKLAPALEQALKQLSAKGVMNELYLRYFPVGFF
ncbi:transporter substrate-binding domain-containing protein [Zhengella sp. ZM62]|uniref:transporter substrate-binding domain-containing protein n=1 Tax=Zhengella sedimenti TaxID=3390035 RepID=UPI0039770729